MQASMRKSNYYVITKCPKFGSSLPTCSQLLNFGNPLPPPPLFAFA